MKKKPRFFCDNCGVEVGHNAKACPQCGRFFASVRCPACGFIGEEKVFLGGCPACGYSAPPAPSAGPPAPASHVRPLTPAGKLPLWVYILAICAFIGIMVLLLHRI